MDKRINSSCLWEIKKKEEEEEEVENTHKKDILELLPSVL